jgi:putative OPT family oligopeptide transporter
MASGVSDPTTKTPPSPSAVDDLRELTPRAIILGIVLAVVLGAANAYLGLYAGLTVSASIPAAVVSMAILRVLGGSTILENNVVQTVASAGEAVAAGAIFTFPALVILGFKGDLPYLDVTALCLAGGTMGSLLVVFLRRAYIVEEKLPFPEGVACAEVLRAGAKTANASPLLYGGILSAVLKTSQDIAGFVPDVFSGARWIGGAAFAGSFDISAALLGVGYIVGVRIAMLVFFGGAIAWFVAVPIVSASHPELRALGAYAAATQVWSDEVRYLGVGAMLTGGIVTLWRLRTRIMNALVEGIRVVRAGRTQVANAREDTDLSPITIVIASALALPVIFALCMVLTGSIALSIAMAVVLAIVGFFATAVAGYLSGLVGASNNPVSGVTVIVLLVLALFLKLLGVAPGVGPRLAIMAGAVVCTAAAMAGDSMHDLATGYFVGATPRSLEIAVLIGAIASAFVVAPVLNLLLNAYGIAGTAGAKAHALAAPQAFLMAKVTQGFFSGGLRWGTISIGAVLAAILAIIDGQLELHGSSWRTPIMPVAIGLYLPFGLSVAILIGSLASIGRQREEGGSGILFAAGLVAGEALMGVANGALVTAGIKLPLF